MFTRRKHNRSGSISVVVIDKRGGGFKEVHRVGVARSEEEAALLEAKGRHWIATYGGQQLIDFDGKADKELLTTEKVADQHQVSASDGCPGHYRQGV